MKIDGFIGMLFLGSLVACSGADGTPSADAQQPAASTTGTPDTTTETPTTNAAPAPSPTTDPSPDVMPAGVPETCATLAAKAPEGTLSDVKVKGMFGIDPVDVYALESEKGLEIVLTETAAACRYGQHGFQAAQMNELSFLFPKTDKLGVAKAQLSAHSFTQESGATCTNESPTQWAGTALAGGSAQGKLTITKRTEHVIEGSVAVTDGTGEKNSFAFTAPICQRPAANAELTCCEAQ